MRDRARDGRGRRVDGKLWHCNWREEASVCSGDEDLKPDHRARLSSQTEPEKLDGFPWYLLFSLIPFVCFCFLLASMASPCCHRAHEIFLPNLLVSTHSTACPGSQQRNFVIQLFKSIVHVV